MAQGDYARLLDSMIGGKSYNKSSASLSKSSAGVLGDGVTSADYGRAINEANSYIMKMARQKAAADAVQQARERASGSTQRSAAKSTESGGAFSEPKINIGNNKSTQTVKKTGGKKTGTEGAFPDSTNEKQSFFQTLLGVQNTKANAAKDISKEIADRSGIQTAKLQKKTQSGGGYGRSFDGSDKSLLDRITSGAVAAYSGTEMGVASSVATAADVMDRTAMVNGYSSLFDLQTELYKNIAKRDKNILKYGEASEQVQKLNVQIANAQKNIDEKMGVLDSQASGVDEATDLGTFRDITRDIATDYERKSAEKTADAAEGLGTVGSYLVKIGIAGAQMALDTMAGNGNAMPLMLLRSFGYGAQEAYETGGDLGEQLYSGAKNAGIEWFTEKLFAGNPVYDTGGKALITDNAYKLAQKVFGSEAVKTYLRSNARQLMDVPLDMMQEGVEEVLADYLNPLVDSIRGVLQKNGWNYEAPEIDDVIDSFITGAALSLGGKALSAGGEAYRTAEHQAYIDLVDSLYAGEEIGTTAGQQLELVSKSAAENAAADYVAKSVFNGNILLQIDPARAKSISQSYLTTKYGTEVMDALYKNIAEELSQLPEGVRDILEPLIVADKIDPLIDHLFVGLEGEEDAKEESNRWTDNFEDGIINQTRSEASYSDEQFGARDAGARPSGWVMPVPSAKKTTRQGFEAFPEGDVLKTYIQNVKPEEDKFDVAMHGIPTGVGFGTRDPSMTARELARIILRDERYHGQEIRLLACNTGKLQIDGQYCFAEELSNALGVTVYAPNMELYVAPDGTIRVGVFNEGAVISYEPNQKGRRK